MDILQRLRTFGIARIAKVDFPLLEPLLNIGNTERPLEAECWFWQD